MAVVKKKSKPENESVNSMQNGILSINCPYTIVEIRNKYSCSGN